MIRKKARRYDGPVTYSFETNYPLTSVTGSRRSNRNTLSIWRYDGPTTCAALDLSITCHTRGQIPNTRNGQRGMMIEVSWHSFPSVSHLWPSVIRIQDGQPRSVEPAPWIRIVALELQVWSCPYVSRGGEGFQPVCRCQWILAPATALLGCMRGARWSDTIHFSVRQTVS